MSRKYDKEDVEIEMSWLRCIDFDNEENIKRAAIEILDMKELLRNECPEGYRRCPYNKD